jgi:molybdopterin-synthase adenylyltransferase
MSNPSRPSLTDQERSRFVRQISIPHWGEEGQAKLRSKSALVTRVGGLGGPAAIGLAMAGIGKLVIAHGSVLIDPDLNRQLLFTESDLGKPRAPAAKKHLESLSKFTEVVAIDHEPNDEEALELAQQVDIVLSCPPGWEERFRLNRACVQAEKPMIEAAMAGLEGTITSIIPGQTACLECIISETHTPPFEEFFPVLGSVSHVMGSMAATEAIKVLTGLGRPLFDRRLHVDLGTMEFRTYKVRRHPDCPVCGNS